MQIVESGAARGADVREGRRLASLGAAPVREGGEWEGLEGKWELKLSKKKIEV